MFSPNTPNTSFYQEPYPRTEWLWVKEKDRRAVNRIGELVYDKDEVLNVLRNNREKHQAIFEEAVEGYRAENERLLEEHLADVRAGKVKEVFLNLPAPVNHTKDYDRVITMLEMAKDTQVTLNEDEIKAYVMDDWSWKARFLTANSMYSGMATRMLEE